MVTIWGESAGAGSVIQHLVAHSGNTQPPLFKQAMSSSTFLPSQYNFDDPISEVCAHLRDEVPELIGLFYKGHLQPICSANRVCFLPISQAMTSESFQP